MSAERYDAIVIGAGQGGGPLARAMAEAGRRTAVIERSHVGGTCINEGCTPTKTMVASARIAHLVSRAGDYGVDVPASSIDMRRVRARKRSIVESFRAGSERRLNDAGVDVICGEAGFADERTVRVRASDGERTVRGDLIFINTGGRPAAPDVAGADGLDLLDSTSVMELDAVPHHLLVVGGGYIGLEFAQMFRRFGAEVTLVQRGPQLLEREDEDVAEAVTQILRDDGIRVLLDTEPIHFEATAGGVQARLHGNGSTHALEASHVLMAAGRVPNTDALMTAAAGVETDARGFIRTNARLETSAPGIYALGDVRGGPAFTHISYDDYRILRTNLLEGGNASTEDRLVPYTVFIDPQLGRVGMSEKDARQAGRNVRVARLRMKAVARALEVDETRGFMKVLIDPATDLILGCCVLGVEGGEIMSALQIAMMGQLPYTALRDGIFAHPTLAESFNNLFAYGLDA